MIDIRDKDILRKYQSHLNTDMMHTFLVEVLLSYDSKKEQDFKFKPWPSVAQGVNVAYLPP